MCYKMCRHLISDYDYVRKNIVYVFHISGNQVKKEKKVWLSRHVCIYRYCNKFTNTYYSLVYLKRKLKRKKFKPLVRIIYSHLLSTLSIDLIHRMDELHRKYKNNNSILTIEIGDGGSVGNKNVRITKNECGCFERM